MKHRCQSESPEVLAAVGPLIEVAVGPPILTSGDFDSVPKQTIRLLVDTGAQKTVVDRSVADALGLVPVRFEQMVGVSHIPQDCPVYLMTMAVGISDGILSKVMTFTTEMIGMETPPSPRPFAGLLGRDFFRYMRVVYDGPAGCVDIHAIEPQVHPDQTKKRPTKSPGKTSRQAQRKARRRNRR